MLTENDVPDYMLSTLSIEQVREVFESFDGEKSIMKVADKYNIHHLKLYRMYKYYTVFIKKNVDLFCDIKRNHYDSEKEIFDSLKPKYFATELSAEEKQIYKRIQKHGIQEEYKLPSVGKLSKFGTIGGLYTYPLPSGV